MGELGDQVIGGTQLEWGYHRKVITFVLILSHSLQNVMVMQYLMHQYVFNPVIQQILRALISREGHFGYKNNVLLKNGAMLY
jgi:hypothetical protein